MAHGDNLRAALDVSSGKYDFSENYIYVSDIIKEADFSIANLETVTAGPASGYTSYPLFNTPVEILDAIKGAGFDALVTANNHSLDRGKEGVLATLDEIEDRNLLHTGTYKTPETNFLTYDYFGYGISILAYTQHLNGNEPLLGENEKYMINVMNLESIISDIEKARTHSNLVIVYLHWGNEYTRNTEDWQPSYAKALFEAGADVILGTHPHVVRPAETMVIEGNTKYVIYSMGNYISNFIRTDRRDNAIYTEDGVMVRLTFEIDSSGTFNLSLTEHIPTWPYKYEDENGLHYEIIPIPEPDIRLHENDYADEQARQSYNRTMEALGDFKMK
jgi:poly-gamma-glutamate synthesis protein (capsule biosynthesis protein)